MLGLLKVPSNNGSDYAKAPSDTYRKFTPEELTQIKMLDLRQVMKTRGINLFWTKGQYEGPCPFHEDPKRAPKLMVSLDPKGVWLWRCQGCRQGGTILDFIMAKDGLNFPKAAEYLKQEIVQVPKLNGNGGSLKEILAPMLEKTDDEEKDEILRSTQDDKLTTSGEQRTTVTDDNATFKYGELIYQAKDLKGASKNSLKIILKLIYKDSSFTDRTDLHSARARRSFANQASERLNLQSAQIEEHLEAMMETLEHSSVVRRSSLVEKDEMNEKEKEEAMELLKDPNLLERMASDLDKLGYVGESINKKILYLIGTSRLLDKPISAIVRSGSGAGKSVLMEQVLSLMPQEDVLFFSRITPQSLFYMGKEALDRKVLAIDEREGSQSADYSIRTLQSSGKLSFAAPMKDPRSGEWKTLIREFSARTAYIESSTKEKLNEENLNRCFELYLDESAEQTKKILEAQRKSAAGIDQITEEEKSKLRRLYQNAQRLLEPIEVRIPSDLGVNLPEKWLRVRRDHERFLSLIKAITVLNQHKIEKKPGGYLEATIKDMDLAKELSIPVMGDVFDDMSKPIAVFYEALRNIIKEKAKGIELEDFEFSRRQARQWLGLPDHIIKRSMRALEDLEYVDVKKALRGSRYTYRLVIDTQETPQTPL